MSERDRILLENKVRLQQAASVLRDVLPNIRYGITVSELQQITGPQALQIQKMLEKEIE